MAQTSEAVQKSIKLLERETELKQSFTINKLIDYQKLNDDDRARVFEKEIPKTASYKFAKYTKLLSRKRLRFGERFIKIQK